MTSTSEGRSLRQLQGDLSRAVAELTRPITRKIVRLDRQTTEHTQPSLIEQLRDAVATGREATGGGGGRGNPLPISPDAADLMIRIEKEVDDVLRWARDQERPPIAERVQEIAGIAGDWADVDLLGWIVDRVRFWGTLITDLLDPMKRMHIGAACPACAEGMVMRELVGGERVLVPALQVDPVTATATCLACGHYWAGSQDLEVLAVGIAERPQRPRLQSGSEGNGHRGSASTTSTVRLPDYSGGGEDA